MGASPASRGAAGRRRRKRVVRFGLVLGAIAAMAIGAAAVYDRPIRAIRAAASDYMRGHLAVHRVRRHADVLREASRESGVAPELLAGIMVAESSGDVDAVSSKGAMGLFQLSRVTAAWRAEELGLPAPTDEQLLSDPLLNARLGADNMAWLLRTYDGDVLRALCAYNAGARRLKRLTEEAGGWEAWRDEHLEAGDSRILEYAERVLRYRDEFRQRRIFADGNDDGRAGEAGGAVDR